MDEDGQFLRAILAAPDDRFACLVYADWLDDRGDPRAEYLRLQARLADLPLGSSERQALREQIATLRAGLPSWWLAIVGYRATPSDASTDDTEKAARVLNRAVRRTVNGYAVTIEAATVSGLTGAVAFLESWSKWAGSYHDITYYFRLHDPAGREASCEPYTYNPYFGCEPQFLEWYGDTALMIYQEKHTVQACRFGFTGQPLNRKVRYDWVLDGRELCFRDYEKTDVQRLSVPALDELPSLPEAEARERELIPRDR